MADSPTHDAAEVYDNPAETVNGVTDAAASHAPEPPAVPVVEHVPAQVTPAPSTGIDQLTEAVAGLAETVGAMQAVVLGLVKDERPQGVPWTHAGMKARHE